MCLVAALAVVGCDTQSAESTGSDTPSLEAPVAETPGGDAVVAGTVVSVDASPLAYDGPAEVTVDTGAVRATVFVVAQVPQCAAEGLGLAFELSPGVTVEARGARGDGGVTPCASSEHYLRRR